MTTKKKLLTVVSVVLILGLAAMGILAYLTDRDSAAAVKAAWSKPATVKFTGRTKSYYDRVNLVWGKSSGASGYQIFRSTNSSSGYVCIKTLEGNGTLKWTDTGLNGETKYYYRIRPYKQLNDNRVYGALSSVYSKQLLPKNLESLIKNYVGKPYKHGGNTPKGWDCSGFTQWAVKYLFGKNIPRTGTGQLNGGKAVDKKKMSTWKPGDIIIWNFNSGGVSHVSLYIGDGKMMHALNERFGTLIQDVSYYEKWDTCNYLYAVRRYSD